MIGDYGENMLCERNVHFLLRVPDGNLAFPGNSVPSPRVAISGASDINIIASRIIPKEI